MIIQVFFTISFVLMFISIYIFIRNCLVNRYRGILLQGITKKSKEDIENEKEWKWRYDEFDEVTYDEMMYKFWKPLSSFYEDKSFYQ